MVVEDVTLDPRFAGHPFVVGPPGIRFYAGASLKTPEGLALGTLCILDLVPRRFSDEERSTLEDLAASVVETLELRLAIGERRRAEETSLLASRRVQSILESIADAFFSLDRDWRFTYINDQAERLLGRARGDLARRVSGRSLPRRRCMDFSVISSA